MAGPNEDITVLAERLKEQVNKTYSPEAIEAQRRDFLGRIEALAQKRIEDLRALQALLPHDLMAMLEQGTIPFRTRAIRTEKDGYPRLRLEHNQQDLLWLTGNQSWVLPEGIWRILLLVVPISVEDLTDEEKGILRIA